MLIGAALGGVPAAGAAVSFQRTDIPISGAESVAIGDLDGKNGKDIAVALWSPGSVGVLLNKGNGTFSAMKSYSAGPTCTGVAVDITLGYLTPLPSDGKLDAYVACRPNVVRLRGDGTGALTNPQAFNLGIPDYTDPSGDMLALMRRPDGNPVPLLVLQHVMGISRQLCISYELDPSQLVCNATPAAGPLVVGDLNGSARGVPPDEVIASEGGDKMGIFGFPPVFPLIWSESSRTVPGGVESAALGDIDGDHDLDVISGRPVNSLAARENSIHYAKLNPSGSGGLQQVATALPSTPGVDAVAVADVDGNGCNDIVAAGDYGTGMIHLGNCAAGFDGGRDLPQIGYHVPGTATRVTMAVGDLTCDGRPDLVIADRGQNAVMVYRNTSAVSHATCLPAPTPPPPPPPPPRTCENPGTTPFTVGTPGDDVLLGSAGRDVLSGRGGDDCIYGRGGDDRLSGGSGSDVLNGSSGGDRLNGDAGKDRINGGNGNDDITPGAGRDKVAAQGGNDEIFARDQTRDTIDCGPGRDKVKADRSDSLKNCEFVKRARRRAHHH